MLGGGLAAAVVAVAAFVLYLLASPGGMRPTYAAVDHDVVLTLAASGAPEVIAALERYRAVHGEFPADATGLGPYLGVRGTPAAVEMHGFQYEGSGDRYVIWKQLGWDPTLRYAFARGRGAWIFDPGDGSPSKEIALSPR
jgi:hypothetical protein